MRRRDLLGMSLTAGTFARPLAAESPAAQTHHVTIVGFTYVPARLEVRVGDTIVWTNKDYPPHSATADDRSWDTGWLRYNQTGRIVATTPGTYGYFCTLHPEMTAVMIVT